MSGQLYIGTAGWSYNDWAGVVYPSPKPRGFDPIVFLGHYFNVLEVNTTFYRIPDRRMTESWAQRGEHIGDLLYIIKLYQGFTHTRESLNAEEVKAFCDALEPIATRGLLGCILIQFPWSFKFTEPNFLWLQSLGREFAAFPLAVEMRHTSWLVPEYYDFLAARKIAFVNIDQPLFNDSIGMTNLVFGETAYFRFHGRNQAMWFKEGAGVDERYNYLYSREELGEWVPVVKDSMGKAQRVYAVFNNHFRGKAVCNALIMKAELTGERFDLPPQVLAAFPELKAVSVSVAPGMQRDLFS